MAPEHWSKSTLAQIISILIMVLIFGLGYVGGASSFAAKVQRNLDIINKTTNDVEHLEDTHKNDIRNINFELKDIKESLNKTDDKVENIENIVIRLEENINN